MSLAKRGKAVPCSSSVLRCSKPVGNGKRLYVHEWSSPRFVGNPEVETSRLLRCFSGRPPESWLYPVCASSETGLNFGSGLIPCCCGFSPPAHVLLLVFLRTGDVFRD